MGSSLFGGLFAIMPFIVGLGFIVIFGLIIYRLIKSGMEWNKNNNSPVLTVSAKVVAKRMAVSGHMHHNATDVSSSYHTSSTAYYVTFEVENGDRMELKAPDREYGMLVEGDFGKLTFQGTRFKGFERERSL